MDTKTSLQFTTPKGEVLPPLPADSAGQLCLALSGGFKLAGVRIATSISVCIAFLALFPTSNLAETEGRGFRGYLSGIYSNLKTTESSMAVAAAASATEVQNQ